jgi:hypothetical protein
MVFAQASLAQLVLAVSYSGGGTAKPFVTKRAAALHSIARIAVGNRRCGDALSCYINAVDECGAGTSFLLLALHLKRMGESEHVVRHVFSEGVRADPQHAKLLQAWGLFESNHGQHSRAFLLVSRAVHLDASLRGVLRWQTFVKVSQERCRRARRSSTPPTARLTSGPFLSEPSVRLFNLRVATTIHAISDSDDEGVRFSMPRTAYTVPMSNRGWRGRPARGEDPTQWYDSAGVRQGAPSNYWRQAMDERLHSDDIATLNSLQHTQDNSIAVSHLVRRMCVRSPTTSRKLLGVWAPILVDGKCVVRDADVAEPSRTPRCDRCTSCTCGGEATKWAPFVMSVRRASGPRLQKHRHGEREMHLQSGEDIIFELQIKGGAPLTTAEAAVPAVPVASALLGRRHAAARSHHIAYLSEYLLVVQPQATSPIGGPDVWVRAG